MRASSQIGPVPIEGTLVGNGLYTVTFTPDAPGQYYLDVSFDCKPLPGYIICRHCPHFSFECYHFVTHSSVLLIKKFNIRLKKHYIWLLN